MLQNGQPEPKRKLWVTRRRTWVRLSVNRIIMPFCGLDFFTSSFLQTYILIVTPISVRFPIILSIYC